jgi:hypothetical protein
MPERNSEWRTSRAWRHGYVEAKWYEFRLMRASERWPAETTGDVLDYIDGAWGWLEGKSPV